MHLLIDAQVERQLPDAELAAHLGELAKAIDMVPVDEPHVFSFPGLPAADYGSSGVQYICDQPTQIGYQCLSTSHISLHYMGLQVYIDVFSCRDFNKWTALSECITRFLIVDYSYKVLYRGN